MQFQILYVKRPETGLPDVLLWETATGLHAYVTRTYGPLTWSFDNHAHCKITGHDLAYGTQSLKPHPDDLAWEDWPEVLKPQLLGAKLSAKTLKGRAKLLATYKPEFLTFLLECIKQPVQITLPQGPGPWAKSSR